MHLLVLRVLPLTFSFVDAPHCTAPDRTDDFLLDGVSSRYVPNYIVGSRLGAGATITLKPHSKGFTDPSHPSYILDFFFQNAAGMPEPNARGRFLEIFFRSWMHFPSAIVGLKPV
jgi:hypothetical protein